MLLAQVAFTVMVVFVKIVRQDLSTFEVALWRSVVAIPLLMLAYRNISWKINDTKTMFLRTVLGFGALCSFFGAAKGLFIADLSLISKIQPILLAIIAPIILGKSEKPGAHIWWLMGVAVIGCSILLAPSLKLGSIYGLLAVSASIFSAFAHVFIRHLRNEHPGIIVLWFQTGTGVLSFIACFLTLKHIPIPSQHLWLPLIGVGLMATLGQLLMTLAYKRTKAATVAVASYAGPLVAVFADVIAFNVFPTWNVYLGGSIVIVAGIILISKSTNEST